MAQRKKKRYWEPRWSTAKADPERERKEAEMYQGIVEHNEV